MQTKEAKERVEEIRGFYIHLIIFVMVAVFIVITNFLTSFNPAIYLSLSGWLIGLIIHGLVAFVLNGFLGRKWEEKKIKSLIKKDN